MAHTLQKLNVGNNAVAVVKITDYVQGGEAFTLAELGLTGALVDVIFLGNAYEQVGQFISPRLVGNKVQLGAPSANAVWAEIASQVGINFVFMAMVQGTN